MHRNNQNYKRIRLALELVDLDVVEICALAGLKIGRDRATRWGRSETAVSGRYSIMTDAEFDAFCEGLVKWTIQDETNE